MGHSRGLTLVEVVASTALLGSLLVATLVASSAHLRQLREAHRKAAAVNALDEILVDMSQTNFRIRSLEELRRLSADANRSHHHSEPQQRFEFRVRPREGSRFNRLKAHVVRLEAIDPADRKVVAWVEVMAPALDAPQSAPQETGVRSP